MYEHILIHKPGRKMTSAEVHHSGTDNKHARVGAYIANNEFRTHTPNAFTKDSAKVCTKVFAETFHVQLLRGCAPTCSVLCALTVPLCVATETDAIGHALHGSH